MSLMIVVHGFLNVVIVAYNNYIMKGWWNLKHLGWELLAKAAMDLI